VAVGVQDGTAHSVTMTGGESANPLEMLTQVLTPQQVGAAELAEVAAILEVAREREPATPSEGPYSELQVPILAATQKLETAVPFEHTPGIAVRTRAPEPEPELERENESETEPHPEVEVRILGPVEVHGAARAFTRAWALELVIYLAVHPRGASNEAWATALWPDRVMAPSSLHSTASVARRALGRSSAGVDHLPRSHGRLALGPTVGTDWDRFVALAHSGRPDRWRSALELVRGRPFEGLRSSDWPILEGIGPAIEAGVVDLSGRLAGACLQAGDARGAERSARQGLLVSPYDERLYRMLLRAADLAGNPAGVESIMGELLHLVAEDVEPLESVHPSTMQLYRTLTRRRGRIGPTGVETDPVETRRR
jgi:DNA-binding SARP family transcriptional activator